MLDLSKYQSIGEALRDALDQFSGEVCLIEADREREKERLTYRDFKERAHPLAKALQYGGFSAGARASIIMTNQSKWLIRHDDAGASARDRKSTRLNSS